MATAYPDQAPGTVVLVHGLWFPAAFLGLLAHRLEQGGYRVRSFSYATTRIPLTDSAARLQHLCGRDYPHGVHLLGHSLGGLLLLQMLQAGRWSRPGRVLLLGTPLAGSAVARRVSDWPGADWVLGQAAQPLTAGHQGWPEQRSVGMIAGSRSAGLGRLAGRLPRPNDGTVTVAETQHALLSAHLTLPVSHTGMLASAAVARQAISFLKRGRFSPATDWRSKA
ncbi:MAG: alpha/beta fold hydrolase [Xanthomonadales bacterium]|nr:alpha/beta fold hydrolase [Xanthomonadales bacterium]